MPSPYNTTDLDPETALSRHVYHRDMAAHLLRWTYVLNKARMGERVVDFGCGSGPLLEVLYRNRYRPEWYVGFDIRKKTIDAAAEKYKDLKFPAHFVALDLVKERPFDALRALGTTNASIVASFEVIEHVGRQNGRVFLENLKACGGPDAVYYLSTPSYDEKTGAAENHTYDSGDGRGRAVQEWDYYELNTLISEVGFDIVEEYGTFASQRDYKKHLTPAQLEVFEQLKRYYDSNWLANIMAPIIPPERARNVLRVMRRAR